MKKYDVAVIGGGFAGISAALAASRAGAKVILVEKSGCLGGAATNCLVNPFMRYWTSDSDGNKLYLSRGIFAEIRDGLAERGGMKWESFLEEELKLLLMDMAEEAGVELLFHTYVFEVCREGERVRSVLLATRQGKLEVEADCFVDATGDAQLAYLADCPTILGREPDSLCQPMTLCFRVGNVDVERFYECRPQLQEQYRQSLEAGELMNPREDILVFRTPIPNVLHFNTTRVVKKNPTDALDYSRAEVLARKQVREIYEFMKKHGAGLENSFLMSTAAEIGVRESRMIVGDYVLTERDCRDFKLFYDAIAACNYDIDIHNPEGSGTSHYYFPEGKYYTIPYRSLIPQGAENMLVAGRCISSEHGAQASYRIMPTVCCIGEAAGVAAALSLDVNACVRSVDVSRLQEILRQNGAFLGI